MFLDKKRLLKLKEYAENNPLNMDDILDIYNRDRKPIGEDSNFYIMLEDNMKVIFCVEQYNDYKQYHLAVNVEPGRLPDVFIIKDLMDIFGYKADVSNDFAGCRIFSECIGKEHFRFNIVEIIK